MITKKTYRLKIIAVLRRVTLLPDIRSRQMSYSGSFYTSSPPLFRTHSRALLRTAIEIFQTSIVIAVVKCASLLFSTLITDSQDLLLVAVDFFRIPLLQPLLPLSSTGITCFLHPGLFPVVLPLSRTHSHTFYSRKL